MEKDLLEGLTDAEIVELAKRGQSIYQKRQREKNPEAHKRYMQRYYAKIALAEMEKGDQDEQ